MLKTRSHSVLSQHLFLLLVLCSFLLGSVLGDKRSCFFPNGSKADSDTNCNAGVESVCCGKGFVCLGNGVCMDNSTIVDGKIAGTLWRGSCTDSTWNSPLCPKYCNQASGPLQGNLGSGQALGKCSSTDNTFFCKRDGIANTCADPGTQFVIQGPAIPVNTIPVVEQPAVVTITPSDGGNVVVVSTTIAAPTDYIYTPSAGKSAAPTSAPTGSPPPPSSDITVEDPKSYASQHAVAIGLGVGGSVAFTALVILVLWIFYKHRNPPMELEEVYKGPPPIRPTRPDVNSPFDHREIGDPIVLGKYSLIKNASDRDTHTGDSDPLNLPPVLDPILLPPVDVPIGIAMGSPRLNWV